MSNDLDRLTFTFIRFARCLSGKSYPVAHCSQFVYDLCAMPTSAPCEECQAIILEYERASLDFWLNASEETRDACRAIGQLVAGGTDADLARAHELLAPFKPCVNADVRYSPSRMGPLFYKKFQHEAKTGHYISLRLVSLRPSPPSDLS